MNKVAQKGFTPIVIIVIVVAIAAVAGGGYFFTQKQVIKTEDGTVTAEKREDVVKISGEEGDWIIAEGKLPTNFPKNLPIYPNSKIISSSVIATKDAQEAGASIILETTDDPTKIYEWYKKEMENKGWKFTVGSPTDPAGPSAVFTNQTQGASFAILKTNDGKIQINLSSSSKQEMNKIEIRDENGNQISAEEAAKRNVQTLKEMEAGGTDTQLEFGNDTQPGSDGE